MAESAAPAVDPVVADTELDRRTLRKITWRLAPFVCALYVMAILDRGNIGFAALEMNQDLGFSAEVFGFGGSVFYLAYAAVEIPSNLMLVRVGARRWIARIMITWGIIATSMMFVRTPLSLYVLRMLLGAAEGGLVPGVLFHLTNWFPAAQRARACARFMVAAPLGALLGGLLAGPLLALGGTLGLAGWQWLFLLEGVPAILLGIAVLLHLDDHPRGARWLSAEERAWLTSRLRTEQAMRADAPHVSLGAALLTPVVFQLGLIYFFVLTCSNAMLIWAPQLIKSLSPMSNGAIGRIVAAIYLLTCAGLIANGMHSDRRRERKGHVAAAVGLAALGALGAAFLPSPPLRIASLALITLGSQGTYGPFWAIPPSILSGRNAAAAIAFITSLGQLGGFVGSNLFGVAKQRTGSYEPALLTLGAMCVLAAVIALRLRVRDIDR